MVESTQTVQIAWGLEIGTKISRHVSDVDRGKACNCICLSCGKQLIAAKGESYADHFRHFNGGSCSWESVLHKLAKEIIISEAKKGNFITLPKFQNFTINKIDVLNNRISKCFNTEPNTKWKMIEAVAEKKMDDSTISDLLVHCENGILLVVEIYVTHEKDDKKAEVYSNLILNSIEIDLSGISWETKYDELCREILCEAPRKWLNEQETKNKYLALTDELKRKVDEKNDYYKNQLVEYIKTFNKIKPFANANLVWPHLSANKFKRHKEFRPIVAEITGDWQMISFGEAYVCEALTQSQDKVKLCVRLPSYKEENIEFNTKNIPILYCSVKIGQGECLAIESSVYWKHIECWIQMLEKEGKNNEKKLSSRNNNKNIDKDEIEFFSKKNEREKYDYLLEKLDFDTNIYELGCFAKHWNLSEKVWMLIIRYFFIINPSNGLIVPDLLAMNSTLVKLTGAPDEYHSYQLRVHDIHNCLLTFEKYGLVTQISVTEFLVN